MELGGLDNFGGYNNLAMPRKPDVDLTSLEKTVAKLREGVASYAKDPSEVALESVVKRFELTYELARNTLVRFLRKTSVELKDKSLTLSYVIRTANQDGLLQGTWRNWAEFRDMRNEAAHAYNEPAARDIAEKIPRFLEEAEFLLARMRERIEEEDANVEP